MTIDRLVELAGRVMDIAGVAAIVGGVAWVTVRHALAAYRRGGSGFYDPYRRAIGRAILLGLELLVAADIIRTVAVGPTFEGVAILGLIVLIRTALSFSLEVELYGRWPWQRDRAADRATERR